MKAAWKRWLLVVVLMGTSMAWTDDKKGSSEPVWYDIEAEDFDHATYYPDWHTQAGQGWYAMEQRYFSGYAGAICDVESVGAQITYTLQKPLPAGTYKFFLHLIKMREGGKNGVEITVGDQRWPVIWDASTYRVRDCAVNEHLLTLAQPADKIIIKSLIIERHHIGDVPSYPLPTIMLDRIKITSDLRQQVIDGGRQTVGIPETAQTAPVSKEEQEPIPPGNRLRNGSFEVGTTITWFGINGCVLEPASLVGNAIHGSRCLELPSWENGTLFPGIFSSVFRGRSDETVPVSLYLKSTAPINVSVHIKDSKKHDISVLTAKVTPTWQKFSGIVKLPVDASSRYFLSIHPEHAKEPTQIWVDAVAVGLAAEVDYQPKDLHEAGLASVKLANIYHEKDRIPALLTLANYDGKSWQAKLELVVRDHRDAIVARRPMTMGCPAAQTCTQEFDVACGRWGIFSAVVHDLNTHKDLAELCYVAIPTRTKASPGMLGFCGVYWDSGRTAAIFKELGISWNYTLADGQSRHIRTSEEEMKKLDDILAIPQRYGVGTIYATEILFHEPQQDLHYEGTLGEHAHPPSLPALERDLAVFAARYRDKVAVWNLQDELAYFKCPLNAWPLYHKAAVDAIRKANPNAQVIVSSLPAFQEQVLKVLGKEYLAAICDCAFSPGVGKRYLHVPYAALARQWKLPLWFWGFGFSTRSFYRTRASDMGYKDVDHNRTVDRTTAVMIVNCFEFDACSFLLYSAAPSISSPIELRKTNIYDADGSLIPLAPAYAAIGHFLEDATDAQILRTPHEDIRAFAFKRMNDHYLAFFVDPGLISYGNISRGDYRFDLPLKGTLHDVFGNPLPAHVEGNVTRVRFEGQPLFMNLGNTDFPAIVHAMESAKYQNLVAFRGFCALDKAGRTVFRAAIKNDSDRILSGQLHVSEERGLFSEGQEIVRDIGKLASGATTSVDVAAREELVMRHPLGNGSVRATLADTRYAAEFGVWCMPALKTATSPKLDGRLDDWKGIAPAFIHPTRRASGGYGLDQVRRGAERILKEGEIGCATYATWDDRNLYLALKVTDNEVRFPQTETDLGKGDHAIVCIDTQLQEDMFDTAMSADDFMIKVQAVGETAHVVLEDCHGGSVPLQATVSRIIAGLDSGSCFEIVCPWEKLGLTPRAGTTMGFDTTLYDADESLEVQIEAAWAGFNKSSMNPTGYGQLILR